MNLDDIFNAFVNPQTILICLVVYVMTFAIRTAVEALWKSASHNLLWNELFLPLGPIANGALLGLAAKTFVWPEVAGGSLAGRMMYGAVCGLFSAFVYGRARSFAEAKASSVLGQKLPSPLAKTVRGAFTMVADPKRVASKFTQAERLASDFFELRYARLLVAMTLQEAKKILGLDPLKTPTEDEIRKAYRALAFANHPDRGGTHEKIVEINTAKDVLEGKQKPTWTPSPSPRPSNPWPYPGERGAPPPPRDPPKPYTKVPGVTFAEAKSAGNVPTSAEWKVCSTETWPKGDAGERRIIFWVVYGQTNSQHVFLLVTRKGSYYDHEKRLEHENEYGMAVATASKSQDLIKIAPKLIKSLMGSELLAGRTVRAPVKYKLWPESQSLTEETISKIGYSGAMALKDALKGAGVLTGDEKGMADRKSRVEVYCRFNQDKYKAMQAKKKSGEIRMVESWQVVDMFVVFNGKEYQLADDTIENLQKNNFILAVFGYKMEQRKVLNNNTGKMFGRGYSPGYLMGLLADALTSEPSSLIIQLTAEAEKLQDAGAKTACMRAFRASTTLEDTALMFGLDLYDAFRAL
jgi:hypothetical protein